MPNYSLSKEARRDIDEILVFIAADNIDAAVQFNDSLEEFLEMLGDNPLTGRARDDVQEGLRYFPFGSYLVFYRVWAGKVTVVRVLHSAREVGEQFS
ncbi:MAG: type II toxin-antitoxin system RelE/ParE family toxin [Pyrinomonadaceae bacterium]|nr:type II toxin-antitoxin system RelE/ParE family toxin [Pyrinomonadaceae bacterium]